MNTHAEFAADAVIESDLSELGQAALYYASLGYKVFPCAPNAKAPQIEGGRGQHDAVSDPVLIRFWWRKWPDANIGLHLKPSGLVCLDADTYKPECQWEQLRAGRELPATWEQDSPRGGKHYIFRAVEGVTYGDCRFKHVDLKWDGYIVAAPSVVDGKPYTSNHQPPALAPDWVPRKAQAEAAATLNLSYQKRHEDRSTFLYGFYQDRWKEGFSVDDIVTACMAVPEASGADRFNGDAAACRADVVRVLFKTEDARREAELGRQLAAGIVSPHGAQSKKQAIRWLDFGEVEATPPVWLVDGFLEQSCMVILFGEPGSAKSFLALDWALCIATGSPWLDRDVEQGQVIYIAGEGHSGLSRRRDAWFRQRGIANPGRDLPFKLSGHAVDVPEACDVLLEDLAALSVPPSLIVIDTLNRNFGGGNENDTKDMTAFTHAVDRIRTAFPQAAVVVVHHTGLAEKHRERGSNSLRAASEAAYRMDIAPEKDGAKHFVLVNVRMKDGPAPDPVHLKLEDVRLSGEMGSAVLMPGDAPQSTGGSKINGTTQAALDALIEAARSAGVRGEDGRYRVPEQAWRDAFYAAQGDMKTSTKATNFRRGRDDLAKVGKAIAEEDGFRLDHATSLHVAASGVFNT